MIFLRNDDGSISVDGGEFAQEADFSVHLLGQSGGLLETTIRLPDAERVLEAVYEDRVKAARLALGADFSILRATA